MKSSTFIGILLTFLMFLMVMGATIVFLWQGRQQMQTQIDALETEVAALSDAQVRAEANLAAESAARATTQADLGTRQAEFDLSEQDNIALQQEVAALADQLTRIGTMPTATTDPTTLDPPRLYIFLQPDETAPQFSFVDYTVLVGHSAGINRGTIAVNGELLNNFQANGLLLVPIEGSFAANTPGELIFTVVATSTTGVTGALSTTLTVQAPTPTSTPTPSPEPEETETPEPTNTPTSLIWPPQVVSGRKLSVALIPLSF